MNRFLLLLHEGRMRRSHLPLLMLILLGAVSPCGWLLAQQRENVSVNGEIKGVQAGILHVVTEKGDQWLVQPPDKAENVVYAATAEPGWLRPGLMVRYVGRFTPKGLAVAPIQELAVFTPTPGTQMGIVPDNAGAAGLFADPVEKQPDPNAATSYLVAGKLAAVKDNKFMVTWGNATVTAPLAEKAKITVEVADLSLVRLGDKVELQGWYYPMLPGRLKALRINVTSPEPLSGPSPEQGKGRGRRGASSKAQRGGAAKSAKDAKGDNS